MQDDKVDDDLILNTTCRAIDEAMQAEPPRPHLGMSQIGKQDARMLWFKFRWSLPEEISPQLQRIFRLGHILEDEVIALLKKIPGIELHTHDPSTGKQFNFSFCDGHFGGSMDACAIGIPEAPKSWHVVEIKSVADKRFKELQKQGVEKWSPEYYAQMQCYMGASGMERALFVAYNKNDSTIHCERIERKPMLFDGYMILAERIIQSTTPPPSIWQGPDDVEAKKHGAVHPVYWGTQLPTPNCRNCRFSKPISQGRWWCDSLESAITIDRQREGCHRHNFIPELVPAQYVEAYSDCVEYLFGDVRFWNADANSAGVEADVYSSRELAHLSVGGFKQLEDQAFKSIRETFEGQVVG